MRFNGHSTLVIHGVQGSEIRGEIVAGSTGHGAGRFFGDMGMANRSREFADLIGGLIFAQHVINIGQQLDVVVTGSHHHCRPFGQRIDEVAFTAVECFDDNGHAVFGSQGGKLLEQADELLLGAGDIPALRDLA